MLIEHEQWWLPQLSPRLPVPIPIPVRVGVPSQMFGWAWSVVRWLPGRSLLHAAALDPVTTGTMLERFLRALHQPAPVDAPRNPWRGVPLDVRTGALHEHLHQLDGAVNRAAVLRLWDRVLSAPPWSAPPLWLHGDLHPGNLLVNDGRLAGVIDFGDLTGGDPATDLAVLWMLPRPMRWRFEAWVGDQPEALGCVLAAGRSRWVWHTSLMRATMPQWHRWVTTLSMPRWMNRRRDLAAYRFNPSLLVS